MVRREKGYRLHAWGTDPVWEEFEVLPPQRGEALVRVEACGVGLTVLNWAAGDLENDASLLPRVPGHEIVGTVTEVGDGSGEALIGKRITVHAYLFCGECRACIAGQESRCVDLAGWVGLHRDGGYAPFTTVPVRNLVPLGDKVDPVAATVVPDAVSTSVHVCLNRAKLAPGDRVVIVGAGGGVGIHMVQVARLVGASVVGLDLDSRKLEAVEQLGVRAVDGSSLDQLEASSLWNMDGPTVVIDLVGTEETLSWSLDGLSVGGRLVVLTTFRDQHVSVLPRTLVSRELSILASRAASKSEYLAAADLVASGRVKPILGETCTPNRLLELHDQIRKGTLIGRGALTWV